MKELTIKQDGLLKAAMKDGLDSLLQPCTREIFLADTYVSGILFRDGSVLAGLKKGDELFLKRENSPYDKWTVAVFAPGENRIGELPEYDREIFAHLLDAGKALKAKIKLLEVTKEYQTLVLSIFLIDF